MEKKRLKIDIAKLVGQGYGDFFRFKGRYKVVKGSRGSKKSKTIALMLIYYMLKYPQSNILVIRKTLSSMKQSCWTELRWATEQLGVEKNFKFVSHPLEATYLPTGQKIIFRGLKII